MRSSVAWLGVLVACGGGDPKGPVGDDDDDDVTTSDHSGHTGYTTDTESTPTTTLSTPEVDADCWAWRVTRSEDGDPWGSYVYVVDPDHLETLRYEADYDPDGVLDYVSETDWLDGTHVSASRVDDDGDGVVDFIAEYTYDVDLLRTEYRSDDDGDGTWDEHWTYTYAAGQRLEASVDEGDDGTVDLVYRYLYDAEGRLERIEGDRGLDGIVDELYLYVYTAPLSSDYTYTSDADGDGVPELTLAYVFDGEGRSTSYHYEDDEGFVLDRVTSYVPGTVGDPLTEDYSYVFSDGSTQTTHVEWAWHQEEMASGSTSTYAVDGAAAFGTTDTWTWTCPDRGF